MRIGIVTRRFNIMFPVPFQLSVPIALSALKKIKRRALVRKAIRVIESDRLSFFVGENMQTPVGNTWTCLTGGEWGSQSCSSCGWSLGGSLTCYHCGFINAHVDSDDKPTNLCQNSTELVETDSVCARRHRYVGHFGD